MLPNGTLMTAGAKAYMHSRQDFEYAFQHWYPIWVEFLRMPEQCHAHRSNQGGNQLIIGGQQNKGRINETKGPRVC